MFDVLFYVPTVGRLLSGDPDRPPGGAETQIRLLAQELASRGLHVAVVAFDQPGLPAHDGAVHVIRRPPHRRSPVAEALAIASALRRAPSRVVVSRQAGAHTGLVALAARLSRRRFVYSAANVLDFDFGSWERSRLKRLLFGIGLRAAGEIIAQTNEQRDLCVEKLGKDAPVIRSIAEPAEPRTRRPEAFLWIGRIVGYKQPLAYLDLAESLPEASFWMVAVPDEGIDSDRRLLQEVRQRASTLSNLTLIDPLPRRDVVALMERAVAIVSTSQSEGMPNVWLEGWARGVPALTLDHDPDGLVGEHGLGESVRGDTTLFRDAASRMWEQRDTENEWAARCRSYVEASHSAAAVGEAWRRVLAPTE